MTNFKTVIYVPWRVYVQNNRTKQDGGSLHLTSQDAIDYTNNYWKKMNRTWHEYPACAVQQLEAFASSELYGQIKEAKRKKGLRLTREQQLKLQKEKNLIFENKTNEESSRDFWMDSG